MSIRARFVRRHVPVLALLVACLFAGVAPAQEQWYKGNTHVHSRWSDGKEFPEMVAQKYKDLGFHFLVLTDHSTIQAGEKWVVVDPARHGKAFAQYLADYGDKWVEQKKEKKQTLVRCKTLEEYRGRFEEKGKFLLIRGQEITDPYMPAGQKEKRQLHANGWNLVDVVGLPKVEGIRPRLETTFGAVLAQSQAKGQPMLCVLNHPNWGHGPAVEDFAPVAALRFFEVMNDRPSDKVNVGDATMLSTDRLWDVALVRRLSAGLGPLYGVAADDSHSIYGHPGLGFIVVRAKALTPEDLIASMNEGRFYASSGVMLKEVSFAEGLLKVEIDAQPGVTYTTQFIGTCPGYDTSRETARDEKGNLLPPTQRYNDKIGAVLQETPGPSASYRVTGKELYVRARVISSTLTGDNGPQSVHQTAWTQPVVLKASGK